MDLEPLVSKGPVIVVHAGAGTAAFVLGAAILWRRKGGRWHRMLGRAWVGLMLVVSLSAFGIHELRVWGPFSPIHLLAVFTPLSLAWAVHAARRGRIREHRLTMQATFVGALVVAGGLTFLPGRVMHEVLFGPADKMPVLPAWVLPLALAALVALLFEMRERRRRARS